MISRLILKSIFKVQLSSQERKIAEEAITQKYDKANLKAFLYSTLIIPILLLLGPEIVGAVIIPVTIVSGTAWFSISLANLKEKFSDFGLELTRDLWESLVSSLLILFFIVLSVFVKPFLPFLEAFSQLVITIIFIKTIIKLVK